MQTLKDILAHWPILVAIGGACAMVYATLRVKVPSLEKRLEAIEKMDLVTTEHCNFSQAKCQQLICAKIEGLKIDLNEMDKKRQDARNDFFDELKAIHKFVGRVEQFMAEHFRD
jgi:hypothetical protein